MLGHWRRPDRIRVESYTYALKLGRRRAIELHNQRIVPRYDVIGRWREFLDDPECIDHLAQMIAYGEWPVGRHVLEEMHAVRGQYHPAAPGMHAHRLQPGGVSRRRA